MVMDFMVTLPFSALREIPLSVGRKNRVEEISPSLANASIAAHRVNPALGPTLGEKVILAIVVNQTVQIINPAFLLHAGVSRDIVHCRAVK